MPMVSRRAYEGCLLRVVVACVMCLYGFGGQARCGDGQAGGRISHEGGLSWRLRDAESGASLDKKSLFGLQRNGRTYFRCGAGSTYGGEGGEIAWGDVLFVMAPGYEPVRIVLTPATPDLVELIPASESADIVMSKEGAHLGRKITLSVRYAVRMPGDSDHLMGIWTVIGDMSRPHRVAVPRQVEVMAHVEEKREAHETRQLLVWPPFVTLRGGVVTVECEELKSVQVRVEGPENGVSPPAWAC